LDGIADDPGSGQDVVTSSTTVIVGRDPELRMISDFLDRTTSGPGALILEGSAGIGKTTLWLSGVAESKERGHLVLAARPAESEARMSYAALGDLLGAIHELVLNGLPMPLRHALDGALLRAERTGGAPDPRAVSLAAVEVLRILAADRPVVVAIDDVQWLDRPSVRVLSFVLRRLTVENVRVLVSLRLGSGSAGDPIDIERCMPGTIRVSVGPLTIGALGRVVRARTNHDLPRPFVVRLHQLSEGNPLLALEVARATVRDGTVSDRGAPWSVRKDLQHVLAARMATLPPSAHRPLLAIAALSQPTWEVVLEIAESPERSLAGLARAEAAGIIERADGRVRFTHPLLASTVYLNAPAEERLALHLRLAAMVVDPEERARHLALGTREPDAKVAIALDQAARHARARGAPDAAAELADLASEMTPSSEDGELRRRRLSAAEYHFDAGDAPRAHRLLRETIGSSPPGVERAEMLYRLASMSWMNVIDGVRSPSEQALAEAGDDADLQSGIHNALTWVAFYLGDLAEASNRASESADWASRAGDPAVRADARATLAFIEFLQGRPDPALMSSAIDLQDLSMEQASWTESAVYTTPRSIQGLEHMWSGRLADARAVFERELAVYEEHAMYTLRQEVLCYLAELECRAGRWQLAARYGSEAMDIIQESGQTATQSHVVLFNQAWAAALLGSVAEARDMATTGARLAEANDDRFNGAWHHAVLGFIDLSLTAFEGARVNLELAARWLDQLGSVEPAVIPCLPDLVEALVGLGRLEEAERLLDRLDAQAAARERPWASGAAARGRALIAAATGDLVEAARAAERSIDHLERASQPFETARSWLVLGQIHRRAKRKRLAREALERARATFTELGARLWAERAAVELGRIGGRPSTPFELTETEASIASLVARGYTNREAADSLFLSPATVQASLKKIYSKLGVRSRTELAARLGGSAQG
jgi:DNA-binding CsgD family transcriptional regulator